MVIQELKEKLIRGDAEAVSQLTLEALADGIAPQVILERGLIAGMNVVGERFKNNDIFLPEVLIAARAMKAGVSHLEPLLAASGAKPVGKFLIGTVKGDIHDIGKNLVIIMLRGAGFDVVDLGVSASARNFIEAIETHRPDIVGMSALLTTTMMQMKSNIYAFREAGVLGRVKVMVGGAPVSMRFAREIGADAYGKNATEAVEKARELMKQKRAAEFSDGVS
jgi:5-methyltetrahydrofolate--homocysteine methyltransferase